MSLKELIANKSEVSEATIEAIVSEYVRYYTDTMEVGFTPEGAALSGERRVLVYLVANLGWRFVADSTPQTPTKPADLEKAVGIPGGTLRPILKSLKDAHLVASGADGYAVREGNLEAIAVAISAGKKPSPGKGSTAAKTVMSKNDSSRPRRSGGSTISLKLEAWFKDGFFEESRTLNAVHNRLHEQGVIAPQTSVSGPLLRAVQQGRLTRRKISEDGKDVWAYCANRA